MSQKSTPAEKIDLWQCVTCGTESTLSRSEMREHLETVHHLDLKTTKFQRQMMAHMDGRDHSQTSYKMTHDGLEINNFVRQPRAKDDPMRHA